MQASPRFLRAAAVASWLSVLTTLGLIFLPAWFAPAEGFDGRMARVHDPVYQLRAWVYLVHPFLVFFAALAVAMRLRRGAAVVGLCGFALWGFTEAAQQALTLVAFDRWRLAWEGADAALRAVLVERTALYDAAWDAMYVLLLIGFAIGNLAYAAALWRGARFDRLLAAFYVAAFLLTAALLSAQIGGPALPDAVAFWLYPALQPLGRALIGAWLWRHARDEVI